MLVAIALANKTAPMIWTMLIAHDHLLTGSETSCLTGGNHRSLLGFLQRTLQRVLVLPRQIHHLIDLCLGDFIRKYAADADALLMDVQHHPSRLFHVHVKKPLEADHHEFHRGVIIIQHQYLELAGLFRFGARAGGKAYLVLAATVSASVVALIAPAIVVFAASDHSNRGG